MVKYNCHKHNGIPNQVILSKTFEAHDFIKMVVLNLMYDVVLKLPNSFGHKIVFDTELKNWLNESTMIMAMDTFSRQNYKTTSVILSYADSNYTLFNSNFFVRNRNRELL